MKKQVVIKRITHPTTDSVTLWFDNVPELSEYKPGQHVSLTLQIEDEYVSRNYSFNTSPYTDDELGITIRAIPNGKVSTYLLTNAKTGMEVFLEGPLGDFSLQQADKHKKHYVFLAGGSGITPIISMIRSILYSDSNSMVSLIYANHSFMKIIFREEIAVLERVFSNRFSAFHVLSDVSGMPEGFTPFYSGRLSRLIAKKQIKQLMANIDLPTEFYLCGPLSFMEMLVETLSSMGISGESIHKEHFFVPGSESTIDFDSLPPTEVIIRWRNQDRLVQVATGQSILDAALQCGLKLPHSCKEGQCGSCRSALVSGSVELRKNHILTDSELREGQVLLCEGFPISSYVVIMPINQPITSVKQPFNSAEII